MDIDPGVEARWYHCGSLPQRASFLRVSFSWDSGGMMLEVARRHHARIVGALALTLCAANAEFCQWNVSCKLACTCSELYRSCVGFHAAQYVTQSPRQQRPHEFWLCNNVSEDAPLKARSSAGHGVAGDACLGTPH